ncbi:NAD synthetase [Gluconobacter frateurii]|uniref:Putative endonuclease SegE-like GIY-YIG domain-containing protein n=1 Tax=Gluconobacter frateurii NRIC 0228 TaxID=1307946 RepID=A0ABQ0QDA3_9PROT|nr:NAD synthetase [Gluconobacter frateurii]GBR14090.1 hypothetical protein AA0228_2172 [Gluconobacter frateurii NRIC 0228]GLP92002.1 hypothetical protein GCM10007868_30770 [Gluconobacter frateurii]
MAKLHFNGHWKSEFTEDEILASEGFVYLITNTLTGEKYVGRKYVWSKRTQKVPNKIRKKHLRVESNWRSYSGSSKDLTSAIASNGKDNYAFEILSIHPTRSETNFAELQEQVDRRVLSALNDNGEYEYLNKNILGRYFRKR